MWFRNLLKFTSDWQPSPASPAPPLWAALNPPYAPPPGPIPAAFVAFNPIHRERLKLVAARAIHDTVYQYFEPSMHDDFMWNHLLQAPIVHAAPAQGAPARIRLSPRFEWNNRHYAALIDSTAKMMTTNMINFWGRRFPANVVAMVKAVLHEVLGPAGLLQAPRVFKRCGKLYL